MPDPLKGFGALRRGRYSSAGSDYFLTICLQRPSSALTDHEVTPCCLAEMRRLESAQIWVLRTAVVMPDHLHLLVTLGDTIALSSAIRLFKGRLTSLMRKHGAAWQQNFFDHRLRTDEELLPVFLYIFLNPYRKGLVPNNQPWAGYVCSDNDWSWFGTLTNECCPEPAWLG